MSWEPRTELERLMFRPLNDEEEREFREYARANDPTDGKVWSICHPVCCEEWRKRGFAPDDDDESCEGGRGAVVKDLKAGDYVRTLSEIVIVHGFRVERIPAATSGQIEWCVASNAGFMRTKHGTFYVLANEVEEAVEGGAK